MTSDKIPFTVDTQKIIKLLSSEIYDSPYVLLRENVQNAYDAILERRLDENEGWLENHGKIEVVVDQDAIHIADNGIGMTEDVLRNNYWRAGSSGKNNERSKQAGVIGVFGIGAMANFGVGNELRIRTRSMKDSTTLECSVREEDIDINKDCINFFTSADDMEDYGTEVYITLKNPLNMIEAKRYLSVYSEFLPVNVYYNGEMISRKLFRDKASIAGDVFIFKAQTENFIADVSVFYDKKQNNALGVIAENMVYNGIPFRGNLTAGIQKDGVMNTSKNFFGLSRIPVNSAYQLGGFFDCDMLMPTAGRETLTKESIAMMNGVITSLERCFTEFISTKEFVDSIPLFANYINAYKLYSLAGYITVRVEPEKKAVPLQNISSYKNDLYYYEGSERNIITQYSTGENSLILFDSNSMAKRSIQKQYIEAYTHIPSIPDRPTISKTFSKGELNMAELAFLLNLTQVIKEDYVTDINIQFANISHGVHILCNSRANPIILYISKENRQVKELIGVYNTAYENFTYFLKEYFRVTVYPHISKHLPSALKIGVDAMNELLAKRIEKYEYTFEDQGDLDELYAKLKDGTLSLADAMPQFEEMREKKQRSQEVTLTIEDVGRMDEEIPLVTSKVSTELHRETRVSMQPRINTATYYEAAPAIIHLDVETNKKLLTVNNPLPQLNG